MPVAHQLALAPHVFGRDPRLGQSTHPQQIRQVRGVAKVVFHPPVGKALHPQRMRQMQPRPGFIEHIGHPIPVVGGLDDYLRRRAGLGDLLGQHRRIRGEPHRLQPLTRRGHPHHHRAPPMKVQTHYLLSCVRFVHKGASSSRSGWHEHPRACAREATHEERRPRPFHRIKLLGCGGMGSQ